MITPTPYEQGREALARNRARRANPHPQHSTARADWDAGYCAAMRERYGVLTREDVGLPPRFQLNA